MDISLSATAATFLACIGLKSPVKQFGELLKDQVIYWQFKNQITILEKASAFCKKKKIDPKTLPKNFYFALLETAKNEDDEDLQNLWATLLGSAAIGEAVHPSYIHIIQQLSIVEVKILNEIYEVTTDPVNIFNRLTKDTYTEIIESNINKFDNLNLNMSIIIDNLDRLGLINMPKDSDETSFRLSRYALDFLKVCSGT